MVATQLKPARSGPPHDALVDGEPVRRQWAASADGYEKAAQVAPMQVGVSAEIGSACVLMLGPPLSPARGPPTDWGQLVQAHDDRDVSQASPDELPAIDINSL